MAGGRRRRRESSRPDTRTRSGRNPWAAWLPVALVLVVLGSAFAAFELDAARRLGWEPTGQADPAEVAPPDGLELPELVAPDDLLPAAGGSRVISAEKVRRALARDARRPELGSRRMLAVAGPDGSMVWQSKVDIAIPASTMKLLTGVAALEALGAERTFATSVRAGATPDEVVLVGGGDPYLMRRAEQGAYPRQADLATLAARTAGALQEAGTTTVRLGYDDSLFTGPRISEDWPAGYVADAVVSPISALFIDQGHKEDGWGFESDPARAAAVAFAEELGKRGITVLGAPARTVAEARVAPEETTEEPTEEPTVGTTAGPTLDPGLELAAVHSAPVWQLVERVLLVSDNEGAELLAHHVAVELGAEPDFDGAAIAVETVLERLGIDTSDDVILDGSGLSRGNRLTAATLIDVLALAASPDHPELRPVAAGLPVAGFTGSLRNRYTQTYPAGPGRVRAKTGTLTGVHGLAGVTTDLDGNVFLFVFLADRVKLEETLDARDALADLTSALAGCHCSA